MRTRWIVLLLALLVVPAFAQNSPYAVTVPVNDTAAASRDDAIAAALTQVLTRANGGQDPRAKPGYADAMKQPGALVQQYQYKKGQPGSAPLMLEVSFDPAAIRRASGAADPTAGGTANTLLVIVRNGQGQLMAPDALAPLAQAAQARGYQTVFPSSDGLPSASSVSSADPSTIAALTARYHTGLILQGRIDQGNADWTMITGGKAQAWQDSGEADDAVLANGANGAGDRIDRQLGANSSIGNAASVWVSGVKSATDFAALMGALHEDPSIRSAVPAQANGDGVLLQVKGNGSLRALASGVGASGHLLVAQGSHDGATVNLRWIP
ncbi:MAG TPA: DUF2066 domain-containing protein [Pinirhizobacter sp.]|uniref:DUF2066 domain-containing protein n=1 Tax=Pinirhizobacter sp. TaxID=2950432 RepID=UPI002C0494F3|nr:DUF2066 domain-containing protein [Pinirhizobacter sp.]HMH69121.1 DUF2066 domain-containing protein [Pinirhizobacter sp.]